MLVEHFDVLIVGAGLSGIGAAFTLQRDCPDKTYAILEARDGIGGTWDLFRYPGVRSDSDMYTLGYSFRPWTQTGSLADGPSILRYIRDTASEYGIDRKIRFNHRVTRACWCSRDAIWTLEVQRAAQQPLVRFSCNFMISCSGYYSYAEGYTPSVPGVEQFSGLIVHPQKWPASIDYVGKRVVVIGSGATAVTLIPAMAQTAAHVTMLQRSPTYILSAPNRIASIDFLRRWLPPRLAYRLIRWRSILLGMAFFALCRHYPLAIRRFILKGIRHALGEQYDISTHFAPRYNPWDQRLCLIPDGDLFKAIKAGKASVCTDEIANFTSTGIKLKSGQELQADIIVTATGLNVVVLGNLQILVDGRSVDLSRKITYKGSLYSDIPNLASTFGYTNASWTLKCELTCNYICRLLKFMDRIGRPICVAKFDDTAVHPERWLNLTSGYIERAVDKLPKQGSKRPWKIYQNYLLDLMLLKFGAIDDGVLHFSDRTPGDSGQQAA